MIITLCSAIKRRKGVGFRQWNFMSNDYEDHYNENEENDEDSLKSQVCCYLSAFLLRFLLFTLNVYPVREKHL